MNSQLVESDWWKWLLLVLLLSAVAFAVIWGATAGVNGIDE